VVIIEKDVAKNVNAAAPSGMRAGSAPKPSLRRLQAGSLLKRVLATVVIAGATVPGLSLARSAPGLGDPVTLSSLPREAQQTWQLIHTGGPFPYAKDGVVFANREKRLEREPRGYYHEYTVPTPGARNRGARRIICGGEHLTEPVACFYTEDHYNSFHRIVK
jgi:ribonuclease T1